jgi:hypothetical protein
VKKSRRLSMCSPSLVLQFHSPPNRNDLALSVSHSLTSRSLPASAICASARARFYTVQLNRRFALFRKIRVPS